MIGPGSDKNDTNCSKTVLIILVNLPYLDIPKYWHSVVPLSTKLNGKLDQSVENWICQCFSSLVRQIVFSSAEQVFDDDDFFHIENGVKTGGRTIWHRTIWYQERKWIIWHQHSKNKQFSTRTIWHQHYKTDNLAPQFFDYFHQNCHQQFVGVGLW